MKYLFYIFIVLISSNIIGQQKEVLDSVPQNLGDYIFIKPGDTLNIQLNEITILPKPKFKAAEDVRYYLWFRRKILKVYPYAKLASERLDSLNARLEKIPKKRKRRKYTRQIQKYIEGEFTDQIKKMTRTEGRILIKLIHRQTGKTAFNNIKGLRSGWKAFWYNTTANLFKLSLKDEYQPEIENEDFLIEYILEQSFQVGSLIRQDPKLKFDFQKALINKKAEINVDVYKEMFAKIRKKKVRKKKKNE